MPANSSRSINRRWLVFLLSLILVSGLFMGTTGRVRAQGSYTVTEVSSVLECQGVYGVYVQPSTLGGAIVSLNAGTPVQVTGITSNGWFRVDIGGTFYMQGTALANVGTYQAPSGVVPTPGVDQNSTDTSGLPNANDELEQYNLNTNQDLTDTVQIPDPISYLPVSRKQTMEYTLASKSDISKLIQTATGCHADKVIVNSKISAYNSIWNALVSFLKEKQIYTYEEATVNTCTISSAGRKYTLAFGHLSTIEEEEKVDERVVEIAYQFNIGSDYDKILAVHDWICENVEYSYETAAGKAGYDFRSAYDALASGKTVCTGYALLFQKFMDIYEIPCYVATGNNHAWNYVNLDGQWYYIDCTNDDQKSGISRKNFLIGAAKSGYNSYGGLTISKTDYMITQ